MRPTAKMRYDQEPREKKEVQDSAVVLKPDAAFLAERRRQAVRALEQTRKEMSEGSARKALDEQLRELTRGASGPPEPGAPGEVTARVVGVPGKSGPSVPLSGVALRLKVGEKAVAETKTDIFGVGRLELPKGAGAYEIEAVGPECEGLSCQSGSAKEGEAPVHVLEFARTEALAPLFERAEPWRKGLTAAHERRDMAAEALSTALERQEKELTKLIAELEKALG